jgi:hypothetical protein
MALAGRCACGAVTAKITGEPAAVRQCWCRQCQQAAAGGPTHNAMFNTADVDLSGELASHDYLAASGNTLTHFFCASCATQVYAQSSARPQFRTVRLGFLDPGHGLSRRWRSGSTTRLTGRRSIRISRTRSSLQLSPKD